ncbi:AlpA family phage regulatory protein [Rhizobium sp. AB2/73]|uniref:helix-turn-helix transcriptional regulator n=1 Tax=Rhizobium sp. AB2/73 TaxID=2795216 RepID=UPI000DDE3B8F|nr:AlpA family phage regulatory protein [Rhizobium sp. AB2/73]UEQ82349.1 AlpA family phage regulatory protein [Rhizobium sp. AB2/73]
MATSNTLYLKVDQVGARYGVSRPTIWRWTRKEPSFPKPVTLSNCCTRWKIDDLEAWERSKAESNAA